MMIRKAVRSAEFGCEANMRLSEGGTRIKTCGGLRGVVLLAGCVVF